MKKITIIILVMLMVPFAGCRYNLSHPISYIDNDTNEAVEIPRKEFGASYLDNKINKKIIEEINKLDEEVVNAIVNNDAKTIVNMLAPDLNISEEAITGIIKPYSKIITDSNYEYLGRYYFETIKFSQASRAVTTSANGEYDIIVEAIDGEIFVSLIKCRYEHVEELLSVEYIREDGDWNIRDFSLIPYTYNGENALDHYKKAQEFYDAGEYMMAYLHIYTALDLQVGSDRFRYRDLTAMENLGILCVEKMNEFYPMPIQIDGAGGVLVYSVSPVNAPGAMLPSFEYATKYEITEQGNEEIYAKISDEIEIINEELMKLYPEIEEYFDKVMYYAVTNPGGVGSAYRETVDIE